MFYVHNQWYDISCATLYNLFSAVLSPYFTAKFEKYYGISTVISRKCQNNVSVGPDFLLLRPFQFLIHYHQVFQRYTVKAY